MPAGTIGGTPPAPSANAGVVPFLLGTHEYAEKMAQDSWQLQAATNEFVHNITPGGFLRGIRLLLSSTGGVAGTLTADAPWIMLLSLSIENIDGSPILYPMNGYSYLIAIKYFMPWLGDPIKNYLFSSAIATPGFAFPVRVEIRNTAGVLANTDARAQYRIRYTLNSVTAVGTGYTTAPTVTGIEYMESYTQVDPTDLNGNRIQDLPDGLNIARVIRHQFVTLNAALANNTIQLTNTGNELRGIILLTRDGSGVRQNALSDPIRIRLDDRSLGVLSPDELFQRMYDFYEMLNNGTSVRETGVYVLPRFRDPGKEIGMFWLPTTNATYLMIESATASGISGVGTVEVITDEVIPVGPIPADLEGI
jgi:hypothetical protein